MCAVTAKDPVGTTNPEVAWARCGNFGQRRDAIGMLVVMGGKQQLINVVWSINASEAGACHHGSSA